MEKFPGAQDAENDREQHEKEVFELYQSELKVTSADLEKRILDAGSADAGFEGYARKINPRARIVSVDLRPHRNISVRADWRRLPFKEESFDLTLSRAGVSIFETESWIPIVEQLLLATKKGGEVRVARVFKEDPHLQELERHLQVRGEGGSIELVPIGQFPTAIDEETGAALQSEEAYLLVIHKAS